jgi:hypothetical protein
MDAKLLLTLPIVDNRNNLDYEHQPVPVLMTNPDNQYYHLSSISISPLVKQNPNNSNSHSVSIKAIESRTSTRYEQYDPRSQLKNST